MTRSASGGYTQAVTSRGAKNFTAQKVVPSNNTMSEKYTPSIQSPAYTGHLARRLGVSPDSVDLSQVVSDDISLRVHAQREVRSAIGASMRICGKFGYVSGPNYPTKRLLPDRQLYSLVAGVLNVLYEDAAAEYIRTTGDNTQVKLYSIASGEDGYVPKPGETVTDVRAWVDPQIEEAGLAGARATVEATTSKIRVISAGRSADTAGLKKIQIGLSLDSTGALAADGTDVGHVIDYIKNNPDRLDTEIALALNCGSFTGMQKAFERFSEEFDAVYPNANDIPDLRGLEAVGNGNGCAHHHGDAVSVDEVAQFALIHKPRVVGLCCGYEFEDTGLLKTALYESAVASS